MMRSGVDDEDMPEKLEIAMHPHPTVPWKI
jgi:hypothetical protein